MKLFSTQFQDFQNDKKNRFIFMTDGGSAPAPEVPESEEKEKEIDEILKSPLGLSVYQLRSLEERADEFTEEQKAKFRDLVGYFFTVSKGGLDSFPCRILFRLGRETRKLQAFLGPEVRKHLKLFVSEQRVKFQNIVDQSSEWTESDMSEVCGFYKYFEEKAIKKDDAAVDPTFIHAKEKIIKQATSLIYRYQYSTKPEVAKKTDTVLSPSEARRPLSPQEKLLLLEVHKIFPNRTDWGMDFHFDEWEELTQSAMNHLFREDGDATERENPNYILIWELLEELVLDLHRDDASYNPLREHKDEIQKLVKRGNAAQFLHFARNQSVLLRSHLDALREIQNNEGNFLPENFKTDYWFLGVPNEDDARIRELQGQIQKLEAQKESLDEAAIEESLKGKTPEKKQEFLELRESQTVSKENLLTFLVHEADDSTVIHALEARKESSEKEEEKNRIQKIIEKFQTLLEHERALATVPEDEKKQKQENLIKESQEFLGFEFLEKEEKKLPSFMQLAEVLAAYNTAKREYTEKKGEILQGLTFSDSIQKSNVELQKQIKDLESERIKQLGESRKFQELHEYFVKPKEIASKVETDFWSGLESRIQLHQVRAADLALLDDEAFEVKERSATDEVKRQQLLEFRTQFQTVLQEQLDAIKGTLASAPLGREEDKFAPWFEIVDREFGIPKLEQLLREKGLKLREEFPHPQIWKPLMEGALQDYRDKIVQQLAEAFTAQGIEKEVQQQFFSEWERMVRHAEDPSEIVRLQSDMNHYVSTREETGRKVENEKKNFDAYAEDIEHRNKQGHEKGAVERDMLDPTFEARKNWLIHGRGVKIGDEEHETFIPGRDLLAAASLQTRENREAIFARTGALQDSLGDLSRKFQSFGQKGKASGLAEEDLQKELKGVLEDWPKNHRFLKNQVEEMKSACRGLFPDFFIDQFFDRGPAKVVEQLEEQFGKLKTVAEEKKYKLSGTESAFSILPERIELLRHFTDFQGGFWSAQAQRLDNEFELGEKGVKFLKDNEFFDDPDGGRDGERKEFEERFEQMKLGYEKKFHQYHENIHAVHHIVEEDLEEMKDNEHEFQEKYGMSSQAAQDILRKHEEQEVRFEEMWKNFEDPQFFEKWLKRYQAKGFDSESKEADQRARAINEFGEWERITGVIGKVEEDSKGLRDWLENYEKKMKEHKTHRLWQSFSLYDIYRVIKESFDHQATHWKRESDCAVAAVGLGFWGINNRFGKEFARMGEESEIQRVKEFETRWHDKPGWEVRAAMAKSNNQDEVRACINLLNEKGFLKWDSPELWRALNRLQGSVVFNIPEDFHLTPMEIREKVGHAASLIWTMEVFDHWDRGLVGHQQKAEDEFKHDFDKYENDKEARDKILIGMLQKWSRGESDDVDPARYYGFLRRAFENGKMNGTPDKRFYYLIQGVTLRNPKTGETILSLDTFNRLNAEFLARFPHVDFLADKTSWKLNGRIVPQNTPGAQPRAWNLNDYIAWANFMGDSNGTYNPTAEPAKNQVRRFFYHYIHMSSYARDRVQRMQRMSEKEGDHDDAWSLFLEWEPRQIREHLSRNSGGTAKSSTDWWRTFLSAFPEYMGMMQEYIDNGDREWGSQDFWIKERNRVLNEVGSRLLMATETTQALLGNYVSYAQGTRPMFFDKDTWEKPGTDYSPPLESTLPKINQFLMTVFQLKGDGSEAEFKEILDYYGSRHGKSTADFDKSDKWKQINAKVMKLIMEDTGGQYFQDPKLIEKALKTYAATLKKG